MAEIKSSLEIALERAASFGSADDEDARREGEKKGRALARRFLLEDTAAEPLTAQGLVGELASLDSDQKEAARDACLEALAQAMAEGQAQAAEALATLATTPNSQKALNALINAVILADKARLTEIKRLAGEMVQTLADMGVSGSAVRPNPMAHPRFTECLETANQQSRRTLALATRDLLAAF